MTYNHEDWEGGDLAWITPRDEHFRRVENHGRQLRMLIRREVAGPSQVRGGLGYPVGAVHWLNHNGWIQARRNDLILNAERAVAVDPEALDRQNNQPHAGVLTIPSGLTFDPQILQSMTITAEPPATGYPRREVPWSADTAPPLVNCGMTNCPLCNPRS